VNNGNTSVSFAVAVTDQDGDRAVGGNLTIDVMNDSPIALSDTDRVGATQTTPETGNLITGAGTTSGVADVRGADGGLRVVGVAAGNLGGSLDPLTVGAPIVGQSGRGTLTVFADGDYRFNPSGLADLDFSVFTYTIRDSDGSLSQATIRFTRLSGGGNLSVTRSEQRPERKRRSHRGFQTWHRLDRRSARGLHGSVGNGRGRQHGFRHQ
jgi:hypothetical protein